jgi:LemA protein
MEDTKKISKIIKWVVIVAIILVVYGIFSGSYNSMVTKNENVTTAWSQVETQYQRRFDLVPNLVNATKGVLKQEQAVYGAIAEARTRYTSAPKGSNEQVQATGQYESALARLLVVMENYPQLKSIDSVSRLTDEIAGTENRVAVARDRYNQSVQTYNLTVKRFPGNLLAGMFGFEQRDFFKSDEGAKTAPTVNLE